MQESNKHIQVFLVSVVMISIIIVAMVMAFRNPPVTISPNPVLVEKIQDCQLDEEGFASLNVANIPSPMKCSFSIEDEKSDGVLILEPRTIKVLRNEKEVVSLACGDLSGNSEASEDFSCLPEGNPVSFQDITNDGYRDMLLRTMCGAYQCGYTYYIFNPLTDLYDKSDVLAELVSPSYDPDTNTIMSSAKGRGLGDTYTVTTYSLQVNGTYFLFKSCSQDMVDFQDSESDYIYVCQEWNGTSMATTSTEIIPREKVWGNE